MEANAAKLAPMGKPKMVLQLPERLEVSVFLLAALNLTSISQERQNSSADDVICEVDPGAFMIQPNKIIGIHGSRSVIRQKNLSKLFIAQGTSGVLIQETKSESANPTNFSMPTSADADIGGLLLPTQNAMLCGTLEMTCLRQSHLRSFSKDQWSLAAIMLGSPS